MTVVFPEGISQEGNIRVVFVPVIANPEAPTIAEITSDDSVDLSCYITNEFGINREQSTGEDRRLCSKEVFQTLGRVTNSIPATEYIYDPQAPEGEPDNRAYDVLKQGVKGHLVVRYGLDAREVDWAAGQKVDHVPVECGVQVKLGNSGSDEFAKFRIQQMFAVSGPLEEDAVIAA